ncbi:hypothetical protein [Saccharicrinis fermentans]|uniref:Uncharacterized protein n=1 Tax=Saccharicrinis fermentans DSM 9555 = JCM 21142 TaxID=869213 RepID=W7Y3L6_9BACT|nr:hypothetical protein [Saccharicrinis fermentans]GAF02168.1 hypothetical protein JCM21142_3795 [Saccharicrinis fermentans DSM 9555 = JCM 21142]
MNNIKIYTLLLILLGLTACEKNYEAPCPVTAVTWYTSMPTMTEYYLSEGEMMAFIDASQGELSHKWIIQQGSYFLKDGFVQGDSLISFIDESLGLTSEEEAVSVLFTKPGRTTIQLVNTFDEKVTYRGVRSLEAKEQDGNWVIDTSFVVDVYGDIKPSFKVCRVIENEEGLISEGEVLIEVGPEDNVDVNASESWTSVDVEVGDRLMLIDLTKEEDAHLVQPDRRTWLIKNQAVSSTYTDSVALVFFNVYGYSTVGLGSLKSERTASGAPAASAQKLIPMKINVVQSTQPFTYADGAVWTGQNSLVFNVAGEVKDLGDNSQDAFKVHVKNEGKGMDEDIPVTAITISSANATRIELTLAEPVYGDDIITIGFDETKATIRSVDDRLLKSFSDKMVEIPMGGEDILAEWKEWSGFEGVGGLNAGGALRYWVGAQDVNNPDWSRDVSMYFSGEASMKFNGTINTSKNLYGVGLADNGLISAGSYRISHKIFIEDGSNIKILRTDIANSSNGWASTPNILWNLEDVRRGEWVTISQIVEISVDVIPWPGAGKPAASRYSFYVEPEYNPGVTGTQTFYLDDMEMVKVEAGLRP